MFHMCGNLAEFLKMSSGMQYRIVYCESNGAGAITAIIQYH